MSPAERKYLDWLHELIMEQSSGSPYWHSPEPTLRPNGPTYLEQRERDKFEKRRAEEP